MLTSVALAEGATIPVRYTCADAATTGHISLPVTWAASSTAQSYALVMTDMTINLIHWVIWDIPATSLGLPEGIPNLANPGTPAGAKQTTSYDNVTFGYRGPCPPASHVYRFTVSALNVVTLPGITTASSRAQVQSVIAAHLVESASLSGHYGP